MSVYRTFLFAPGNHPRRVEKALSLDADAVILDLERHALTENGNEGLRRSGRPTEHINVHGRTGHWYLPDTQ